MLSDLPTTFVATLNVTVEIMRNTFILSISLSQLWTSDSRSLRRGKFPALLLSLSLLTIPERENRGLKNFRFLNPIGSSFSSEKLSWNHIIGSCYRQIF